MVRSTTGTAEVSIRRRDNMSIKTRAVELTNRIDADAIANFWSCGNGRKVHSKGSKSYNKIYCGIEEYLLRHNERWGTGTKGEVNRKSKRRELAGAMQWSTTTT